MPDDSQPRRPFTERHVSPDGRTILDLMTDFDMRDVHEMQPFKLPCVTDAATGQVVLDLTGVLMSARLQWEADGALTLSMSEPWDQRDDVPKIRIALATGSYATNGDGWIPHPIGEAQAKLPAFVKPPHKPPPTPIGQRLWALARIAIGCAVAAAAIWYAWTR